MTDLFQLTRVDPVTGIAEPVPPRERIDAILSRPDAEDVVRSMDAQALYSLVQEAGEEDTWDLVLMASPAQVQSIIDFDCWTRDELELERLERWLPAILEREEDDFDAILERLDPEVLAVWLRSTTQVLVWEDDRDLLDLIDAPVMSSPCGVYAIVLADEDAAPMLRHVLERIYARDVREGHLLLEASRWELTSDMQERAFQNRTARLGDLGFVPHHEAVEVYAWLDPVRWAAQARARARDPEAPLIVLDTGRLDPVDDQLQTLEMRRFSERPSAFTRALGALPAALDEVSVMRVADSLMSQFRAVANRAHIAEMGQPGDATGARRAAASVDAYVSIGLELAAGEDALLAAHVLARTPMRDLHRAGYSATARLGREAVALVRRGNLGLVDGDALSLLDDDQRELLRGLMARRPLIDPATDRRFESLADVEEAARRLGAIAFLELLFFAMLRFRRDELAALVADSSRVATSIDAVTFQLLFATLTLDAVLGHDAGLRALSLDEVHRACARLAEADDPIEAFAEAAEGLVAQRAGDDANVRRLATQYAHRVAARFADAAGDLSVPMPGRIAAELVLLRAETE